VRITDVNRSLVALLGYRTADDLRQVDFRDHGLESADDLRWLNHGVEGKKCPPRCFPIGLVLATPFFIQYERLRGLCGAANYLITREPVYPAKAA